jgi:hypothetical protein
VLAFFPELMKPYTVFKMKPGIGAGYGKRKNIRKVTGYWSWRKSGKMGIEGDLQVLNHQAVFWARNDFLTGKPLIDQGDFVEVGKDVFRVVEDDNFSHESGFTKCLMQLVQGNTDQQRPHRRVNLGVEDYQ